MDIGFVDRNGCNALHIAASAGFLDIVNMILLYWSKSKIQKKQKSGRKSPVSPLHSSREESEFKIDTKDNS